MMGNYFYYIPSFNDFSVDAYGEYGHIIYSYFNSPSTSWMIIPPSHWIEQMKKTSYSDFIDKIVLMGGSVDDIKINKHCSIYWTYNDKKFILTCSHTPSDYRAYQKNLSIIKRCINGSNSP